MQNPTGGLPDKKTRDLLAAAAKAQAMLPPSDVQKALKVAEAAKPVYSMPAQVHESVRLASQLPASTWTVYDAARAGLNVGPVPADLLKITPDDLLPATTSTPTPAPSTATSTDPSVALVAELRDGLKPLHEYASEVKALREEIAAGKKRERLMAVVAVASLVAAIVIPFVT